MGSVSEREAGHWLLRGHEIFHSCLLLPPGSLRAALVPVCEELGRAAAGCGAEPYLWKARLLQPANAPGNTELETAERW